MADKFKAPQDWLLNRSEQRQVVAMIDRCQNGTDDERSQKGFLRGSMNKRQLEQIIFGSTMSERDVHWISR